METNESKISEKIAEMNQMNTDFDDVTFERKVDFNLDDVDDDETVVAIPAEEDKKKPKKKKKVDLDKLDIVDERDPISRQREIKNALYGNKSMFQIVAAQSGYSATMAPLVHKDAINILYTNLSRYEYKKNLYKVIYEKIVDFSAGKMTFEEWLKETSVEDLETFYYGVYCATFPDQGTLSIQCPHCHDERSVKIPNLNLKKTTNRKEMNKLIADVAANATTREKMKEYSLIGKNEAFELEDSKIVVELRTPSLYDSLELLRLVPEEIIDKDITSLTNMLYINRILVKRKDGKYIEQTDRQEILRTVDGLSIDDAQSLEELVSSRVDEHRITYSIKNYKCDNCGKEIKDIPISIEDILFTLIYDKIQ